VANNEKAEGDQKDTRGRTTEEAAQMRKAEIADKTPY
jgi:hypothetical protein